MATTKVSTTFEETDVQLIASFKIGQDAYDVLEDQIQRIGLLPIPGNDAEAQSVRQWTLYIGTLFAGNNAGLCASKPFSNTTRTIFTQPATLRILHP